MSRQPAPARPSQGAAQRPVVRPAEVEAMATALRLAATPGLPLGPNPRVGCVLLDSDGRVLGEGHHRGAGTAHAEVDALAAAQRSGASVRGATAVVTLEPCNHTGRTGPCVDALLEAGVARVVHAVPDPDPVASGGAQRLAAAGVDVEVGLLADEALALNRAWLHGVRHGRPLVTWKLATTLDGFSAAADGTSRWITRSAARRDVHRARAACDVVLVGTGTALADDPALTVRDADDRPVEHQPLRAVVGERDLPPGSRLLDGSVETRLLRTHDPRTALDELFAAGRRHVFLEGGPTLAAAFLQAGLVDEVLAYVAPALLGAGLPAVGDLGATTIGDALRLVLTDVRTVGEGADADVRLTMSPVPATSAPTSPGLAARRQGSSHLDRPGEPDRPAPTRTDEGA